MSSLNDEADIERLLDQLDGSDSDREWSAIIELRSRLGNKLPDRLLPRYRLAKKWSARCSHVYHAVRYASDSSAAIELALLALHDKAKLVRYQACMLLACSQKTELLPLLYGMVVGVREDTKVDLMAAIDAIESQKVDYFVDRDHSGMISLVIR
jgi:hypothetical protein